MANPSDNLLAQHHRQARALLDAMSQSLLEANPTDVWKYSPYKVFAQRYVELVKSVVDAELFDGRLRSYDISKMPSAGDTVAFQQQEIFEGVRTDLRLLISHLDGLIGHSAGEILGLADFLKNNLRKAMFDAPAKETVVQDAIESLLIGRGLEKGTDYDREVGRVKVSSKEVIPDFVFAPINLAAEVKLVRSPDRVGPTIDEINADITSYLLGYSSVLVVVYDLGAIRDEVEFRRDLEAHSEVQVVVVKH